MFKQSHFIAAAVMTLGVVATAGSAQASIFSKAIHAIKHEVKVVERKTVNTVKDVGRIAGKDVKAIGHGIGAGAKGVANVGLKGADAVGNVARKGVIGVTQLGYKVPGAVGVGVMFGGPVGVVSKVAVAGMAGHMTGHLDKALFKDNGQNRRFLPAKIR